MKRHFLLLETVVHGIKSMQVFFYKDTVICSMPLSFDVV